MARLGRSQPFKPLIRLVVMTQAPPVTPASKLLALLGVG